MLTSAQYPVPDCVWTSSSNSFQYHTWVDDTLSTFVEITNQNLQSPVPLRLISLTLVVLPVRGWQGLIAQGCHSSILIIDPKTAQTIQVLERHKANVVKVSLDDACGTALCLWGYVKLLLIRQEAQRQHDEMKCRSGQVHWGRDASSGLGGGE